MLPDDITPFLASSLHRRDEVPNVNLAIQIVNERHQKAIAVLVANLRHKSKAVRHDSIKVLYEIGERLPELIADYCSHFVAGLRSKDNRMQWGAMTALSAIAQHSPTVVHQSLHEIVDAADAGSVITRDKAVAILIALSHQTRCQKEVFPLLLRQLAACPTNQLPMYAEQAASITDRNFRADLANLLKNRLHQTDKESKRNRIAKTIKLLEQI